MRRVLSVICSALWLCAALLAAGTAAAAGPRRRPVVLLHGLFANYEAMAHVAMWLRADFPGIYVHNADIPVVNNSNGKMDSLLIPMERQVELLAAQLQGDPELASGFDLVCHSQGGLTCRAFIEKYNVPRVHNFISLAGPHAGVFGVPDVNAMCPDAECPWLAELMNDLSEKWATEPYFQKYISFAQYWKNPLDLALYLNVSAYLPDINNERPASRNPKYKANLLNVAGNITLVMAELDHIVVPKESAWFGFFAAGQDTVLQDMTQTPGYQGDWIGLRSMDEAGRLERIAVNCSHQDLPRAACRPQVYSAVIAPRVGGFLPTPSRRA